MLRVSPHYANYRETPRSFTSGPEFVFQREERASPDGRYASQNIFDKAPGYAKHLHQDWPHYSLVAIWHLYSNRRSHEGQPEIRPCMPFSVRHSLRGGSESYLALYTSIVGPSGTGKSFSITQLAHIFIQLALEQTVYVLYVNLANNEVSQGGPNRSASADVIPQRGFVEECDTKNSLPEAGDYR